MKVNELENRMEPASSQDRGGAIWQNQDQELVERAQQGDTEAFGQLIHTYRERAKRWAERMTRDPYMADDIVQDALIRAFLHLGSLVDTNRFLPWLHRIVQNQANMRLRRGGPYKREQPLTSFQNARANSAASSQIDWDDLDHILHHLTQSASDEADKQNDPAEHLLRKELFETIHTLLHCLSRKERNIFEAHFFRQLAPDEIADLYNTTVGSVYTYIHRSRKKLREEQVRVFMDGHQSHLQQKGGSGLSKHNVLLLPVWPQHQAVKTTFVDRIGHMLAAVGDTRSTTELMGISGFAFRMKISNRTTFSDGIYIYDWRNTFKQLMNDLGYVASILCGQLPDAPVPLLAASERFPVVLPLEEAVLPFIRKYIDMGKPVLYFDTLADKPYVHEWSLLYGYDDEQRIVYVTDAMRPDGKTLSYGEIAGNPLRFLAGIDSKESANAFSQSSQQKAKETLEFAVSYARQGCRYYPMTMYLSYTSGLAAYDRWIEFLSNSLITPNRYGMGQLAAVYSEAKRHAARYLRSVRQSGETMRLILLSSEAYEQAAEALETISGQVPFIRNAEMLSIETLDTCRTNLQLAKEFETAAIGYLEKAIILWEQGISK
ncbi:RNA polymerase sigma factor [Paenibacillus radicis (ex Xue et al. 2023)]|uniref:RNA polymerase sigma factor n=1 Tax=Paenibacillus radicis (ex Xue et al. 2023) TaxID=2972489 RepID=A0ABT1YCM3_9BACL|nr:RNA polymerase sigma factor [Paenibacillus radicis (ex Xue et al. 2023)]MCR8630515.1 RNA polymerase sigma factor [Paenibacillus radicis (ex Xue et al. 2023)]